MTSLAIIIVYTRNVQLLLVEVYNTLIYLIYNECNLFSESPHICECLANVYLYGKSPRNLWMFLYMKNILLFSKNPPIRHTMNVSLFGRKPNWSANAYVHDECPLAWQMPAQSEKAQLFGREKKKPTVRIFNESLWCKPVGPRNEKSLNWLYNRMRPNSQSLPKSLWTNKDLWLCLGSLFSIKLGVRQTNNSTLYNKYLAYWFSAQQAFEECPTQLRVVLSFLALYFRFIRPRFHQV